MAVVVDLDAAGRLVSAQQVAQRLQEPGLRPFLGQAAGELGRALGDDEGRSARRRRGDGAVVTALVTTMGTAGRTVAFSALTGGRFARLLQVYDERDDLQLAVERRTGEQVPLSGLSEGTGDQLYLALRLAFLEDYCRRNEPAPLVLDDIFQTFDDERTAAALRTLAEASGTHQTLLFTHHASVVETAKRELGDGVDLVQL